MLIIKVCIFDSKIQKIPYNYTKLDADNHTLKFCWTEK